MRKQLTLLILFGLILFLTACSSLYPFDEVPEKGEDGYKMPDYEQLDFSEENVFIRPTSLEEIEELLDDYGSSLKRFWSATGWGLISIPEDENVITFLKSINDREEILYAEPDLSMSLPPVEENPFIDPDEEYNVAGENVNVGAEQYYRMWGLPKINAPEAWEITTGSDDVVVAIMDTGLQTTHPEFQGHTIVAPYNATDDPYGEEYVEDFNGHGTHVTGTAVSHGQLGQIAGVAWSNPIMPVRVMNLNTGGIFTNYLVDGLMHIADYARDNPDQRVVVNMSIGGRGHSVALKDAIDYLIEQDVLLVAAAGNEYKRVIGFPASYNGVLSVAASDPHDRDVDFSSSGFYNSVAAPGTRILSTYVISDYAALDGTSMSAPHVTGAVALLLSTSEGRDLTVAQLINQVEQTARPGIYGDEFTDELGHGILDVENLLGEIKPMEYGSLHVVSDVPFALITVLNENGKLAGFGTTGEANNDHIFHTLRAGNYTVRLTHDNELQGEKTVTVGIDETKELNMPVIND